MHDISQTDAPAAVPMSERENAAQLAYFTARVLFNEGQRVAALGLDNSEYVELANSYFDKGLALQGKVTQ